MNSTLDSWIDGVTRSRIVEYVERVTRADSKDFLPVSERIVVADNDGTLWPEQPLVVQLAFTNERFREIAATNPELASQQPYKAALADDHAWMTDAVSRYYQGDASGVSQILKALPSAFAGLSIEQYQTKVLEFFESSLHPRFERKYVSLAFLPMLELLRYLEDHQFQIYISSGGDRDFMRGVAERMYGIPPERVIGSAQQLEFRETEDGVDVLYRDQIEVFNDGIEKPMRIWAQIGRRPVIAIGNSNGDIPMMRFANTLDKPGLRILVRHDDAQREYAYDAGAENALAKAEDRDWIIVSMKNDWKRVFS